MQLDFSHTVYNVIAGESVGTANDYRLFGPSPNGQREIGPTVGPTG